MARRPSETTEQNAATRYTARWHRVERWALASLDGDLSERDPPGQPRMSIRHGTWVVDEWDDEEAAERARELFDLGMVPDRAPTRRGRNDRLIGGTRRVTIRCLTWVIELATRSAHDPQWITTGSGFSARAAVLAHNRYLRAYADAVDHGVESRRLGVTAMQIVWWTAGESAQHV